MSGTEQNYYYYEFGPFKIDVANRQLLRDGSPLPVAPKVWDALVIMAESSGRILEKEELMNRLWPDCFVEESNLTQIIFQLRKALGESAAKQQYIETIPKRGYRFVADIRRLDGQVEPFNQHDSARTDPPEDNDTSVPARQSEKSIYKNYKKKTLIAAAILVFSVTTALGFSYFLRWNPLTGGSAASPEMKSIRLLTSSGNAQQPALSHDGKYVAYVIDEAGRQSIYMRQVNSTGNAQVVPPAEVNYLGITFSPDGSFIYYVIQEKDQPKGTLYQAPVLGGTPRKIIAWVDSTVTFSPDGKRLAFVRRDVESKETFLFTANSDGSGEQRLAARKNPDFFSIRGPAWSPDGRTIVLGAGRRFPGDSNMYVVTVDAADGSVARLGSHTWTAVGPTGWLKDGSGIVVVAFHQKSPVIANQLWQLSYPDGEVSRITNNLNSHAGLSIATQSEQLVTARSDRVSRLWVAPDGDAGRARLIRSVNGDNYSELLGLSWTPDDRLVYGSHASGNADIWIMDSGGDNQKQLTYDPRREVDPVVSSDGRYIVYTSEGSGTSYLWRMDIDGRNPRQLTSGKFDDLPSFTPDGRWVVYTSFDESGNLTLWKVSIDGGTPIQLTRQISLYPAVSPDGKLIACQYRDEQTKRMVVAIIPITGGNPVRVFKEMPLPASGIMRWTRDRRALTYILTKDGVSNIWLQPIDDAQPKQLTHFKEDQIFRIAWSRDGKYLAFDRGLTIKDIILISDFR
jgi:Tol biopolymer transport system component/DNA-binding winged helix-turn-helix (wHTH) protein